MALLGAQQARSAERSVGGASAVEEASLVALGAVGKEEVALAGVAKEVAA